ncbi:phage/plasmid primase, P4 family [Alicyclobacillus kakegawensis]|uniref:phage/plasmid primase, P4 family n=1 Tax=Alicyclobacillus kakegawensis TaxID=392012 RepID=UPI00082BB352|nr:phage/plasmid primase, P4 family [Alicyclobacillus kakegawensis]
MPYSYSSIFGVEIIRDWLERVLPSPIRWNGAEGSTRCPFHDDHDPSFSVNVEKGVWYCHAGCGTGTLKQLSELLGTEPPPPVDFLDSMDGPNPTRPRLKTKKHEIEYVYTDADGNPILLVARDGHGRGKRFCQYHFEDGRWWVGKGTARLVPYRLPNVISAVAQGQPVFVVEGEKDADTLGEHGLTATTAPMGAGKWPQDETFNTFFAGADIIILPDNDEPGRKHAEQVAHILSQVAKQIRLVNLPDLPPKGYVTDWLEAGHSVDDLLDIIRQAPDWQPTPGNLVVLDGNRIRPDIRTRYWDGDSFCPPLLAKDILQRQPFFYDGRRLYAYQGGVYRPNGSRVVRKWCAKLLDNHYRSNRASEVEHFIQTETWLDEVSQVNPDDGLINVRNGLLNWETGELLPHTAERLSTIQLPMEYNPDVDCPAIRKFLSEILDQDTILTVLQFIGYCLIPTARYEKAMMFTGRGSNGKSTLIRLITALLGKENTTSIPLQELSESRWKRADLEEKLLNAFADISHKAVESSSLFKSIVSGDEIDAERKHQDPFYFRPFAKLLFSANELPGSRDVTPAYFRRWLIIPFMRTFDATSRDEGLFERLTTPEELSGLLNFALDGLRSLVGLHAFVESSAAADALETYRLETDNVAAFLDEECVVDEHATVTKSAFYQAYVSWCDQNGLSALSNRRFTNRLKELIPTLQEVRTSSIRLWKGVGVQDEQGNIVRSSNSLGDKTVTQG